VLRRSRRPLVLAFALGALLLAPAGQAQAASGATIVPKGGTVAGRTYAQWLGAWWQLRLNRPPDVSICREVDGVAVLIGGRNAGGGGESDACTLPVGQAVYLNGLAVECSTMQRKPLHGSTSAELKSCAKRRYKGAKMTATLDGRPVRAYSSYATASPVVAAKLPRINVLKSKRRTGRVAAYGVGLLLTGLTVGTHVLRQQGGLPGAPMRLTYKLRVTPAGAPA
jgi:hypothetical protein